MAVHWCGVALEVVVTLSFLMPVSAPPARPRGFRPGLSGSFSVPQATARPGHPSQAGCCVRWLKPHRFTFLALFTHMLALSTNSATYFLIANANAQAIKPQRDVAAAGFALLSIFNFAMILDLGRLETSEASKVPTAAAAAPAAEDALAV
jgi:hypothetical protein